MKKFVLPLLLIAPIGVSACTTIEDDVVRFESMSCYQLAQEIGRWKANLDQAKKDSQVALADSILSESKKEDERAENDALIANIGRDRAREYLAELRRIEYQKGCR